MVTVLKERLKLYLVAQRGEGGTEPLCDRVREAVRGGVTVVQLRAKTLAARDFFHDAVALGEMLALRGIPFIVNDRVDLAVLVPGAGVHLGQEDLPVRSARKLLGPDRIIGVSAHTPEEAEAAEADGADYIGAGPAFHTVTKLDTGVPQTPESLARIVAATRIPVVAIGGIHAGNAALLRGLGLAGVAVSSAICGASDPREAASSVLKAWGEF